MKAKKSKPLTQKMLDEIATELKKGAAPPMYDKEGNPIYVLHVVGRKEHLALRRLLRC